MCNLLPSTGFGKPTEAALYNDKLDEVDVPDHATGRIAKFKEDEKTHGFGTRCPHARYKWGDTSAISISRVL